MYLTQEQLEQIEDMAYKLYSPSLIAIAIEAKDADEFLYEIEQYGTEAFKAFYRGYLTHLDEIKADTIKAARNGSNPAQIELCKYINNIQRELKHG